MLPFNQQHVTRQVSFSTAVTVILLLTEPNRPNSSIDTTLRTQSLCTCIATMSQDTELNDWVKDHIDLALLHNEKPQTREMRAELAVR